MKPSTIVAVIFLLFVSTVQLLRFVLQIKVTAGTVEIPIWASAIAFAATGALAIWLWIENKK
ncbi:MAG: hypothetical protein ABII09_11390 [Planctomycetota bacterium]